MNGSQENIQRDPEGYLYSPAIRFIDLTYAQAMTVNSFLQSQGIRFTSIDKAKRTNDKAPAGRQAEPVLHPDPDSQAIDLIVYEYTPARIITNLDAVEKMIDQYLDQYRDLDIIDDQAAEEARKICADMKRIADLLNSWRITKEQEFNEPFKPVKIQAGHITGKILKASGAIDRKIREYRDPGKEKLT